MPTPRPAEETREDWMNRCVPMVLDDGAAQDADQAVAMCSQMWRDATEGKSMNRAYSLLNIKSVDEEKREIEGIASTPTPDRMEDIVELEGMEFKVPMPMLYQHNSRQPIGQIVAARKTKDGLIIRAKVAAMGIAAYIDEAWSVIKAGLVPGLSIGFRPLESESIKGTYGIRFVRSELYEISAVTIPANAEATITAIKSADALQLAALGNQPGIITANPPGVSGITSNTGRKTMKPIADQIKELQAQVATNEAKTDAIIEKADGRTFDEAEAEDLETLKRETAAVLEKVAILKDREAKMIERATPVTAAVTQTPELASRTRGGGSVSVVQVNDLTPKGIGFTRALMALANCKGNRYEAAQQAMLRWPDMGEAIGGIIKAEQLPGTTTGTTWAAPLMQSSARLVGEFIELARAASLVGRIPGLRRVPFNVTVPAQSGGGTYTWVGENQAKPVSGLTLGTAVVRLNKISGIIPYTKEALRLSDPSIETTVRNDMVRGTAVYMDAQFVDPAVHLSIGVNPASITDQIVPTAASGLTSTFLKNDLRNIMGKFVTNNEDLSTAVFLMSGSVALNISSMQNALGQKEFPDMTATGGTIYGITVIVSNSVGARIILVQPNEILFAEDPGGAEIDISEEASVVMDTAPQSSPVATSLVSFWQRNLIGLRVDLWVSWTRAVTTAVEYLSSAVYSG